MGHGYFCTERAEMSSCDRDSVPQRSLKSLLSVSFQKKIIDPWIRELRVEKSELKLRKWVRFPGKKGRLGAYERVWSSPCVRGVSGEEEEASWKPREGCFRSKGVPAAL